MGTVHKETFTKPLPTRAKIFIRNGQRLNMARHFVGHRKHSI